MKRVLLSAACLALVLTLVSACSKKPAETAQGATASDAAAATPATAAASTSAPSPSDKPKTIEITEDMIAKYMQYQKETVTIVTKYAAESKKNLEASKGDVSKLASQAQLNDQMSKELDKLLAAKRSELGLKEDDFALLQEAVSAMANSRALYNQMGGDAQVAKIEAEQKKAIEKMPEAQRAAAQAEMSKMTESLRQMRDGFELRQKYGDKSADVLLKHADNLAQQWTENLKLLGGKK